MFGNAPLAQGHPWDDRNGTFAAGVGAVASVIAGFAWLLAGSERDAEVFRLAVASSIWAFPIGVAFAGFLAITAGGRSFNKLSFPRFAVLGAGAGVLLLGVLASNAYHARSISDAMANLAIIVLQGGGSATGALMLARRAGPALKSGDESHRLG